MNETLVRVVVSLDSGLDLGEELGEFGLHDGADEGVASGEVFVQGGPPDASAAGLVRPTASTWLSPVWTPATSSSTSRSTTNESPDMTLSPPPRAEVYLVENRLNPISTRAALELTDDNLRCTVKEYSKWVEKALGISDLRSRLQAGEAVAAF
jgi:hypothetical protein